jgi:hypothetical protein
MLLLHYMQFHCQQRLRKAGDASLTYLNQIESESHVTTDGQSASLFCLGLTTFLLLSDSCDFVDVGRSL